MSTLAILILASLVLCLLGDDNEPEWATSEHSFILIRPLAQSRKVR
jgi:hypothetical protein